MCFVTFVVRLKMLSALWSFLENILRHTGSDLFYISIDGNTLLFGMNQLNLI